MSRLKRGSKHRPHLRPTLGLPSLSLVPWLFAFVAFLIAICKSPVLIDTISDLAHSSSSSVEVTAFAFVLLLVHSLIYTLCMFHACSRDTFPRLLSPLLGNRRRYRRAHISHMRVDRMRRLVFYNQLWRILREKPTPLNRVVQFLLNLLSFPFLCSLSSLSPLLNLVSKRSSHSHLHIHSCGCRPRLYGGGRGTGGKDTSPLDWLNSVRTPSLSGLIDECCQILQRLPPEGVAYPLSYPGVSLYRRQLTAFLGNTWLDDSAIIAGFRYIKHLAPTPHIAFTDTAHVPLLKARRKETSSDYSPTTQLDHALLPGAPHPVTQVFLPLHVYGNHWTLLHLDLEAKTFSYADCYHEGMDTPPSDDLSAIMWWLDGVGIDFKSLERIPFRVHLPRQLDSSSCGVIILSIVASLLIDCDMWTQERAVRERLLWFIRLAQPLDDDSEAELEDGFDRDEDPSSFSDDHTEDKPDNVTFPSETAGPPSSGPSSSDNCVPPYNDSTDSSVLGKRVTKPCTPHSSETPYDDSDFSDSAESRSIKRRKRSGQPREGSSWARQKDLKAQSRKSGFKAHDKKLDNFRTKILNMDNYAEFKDDELCEVRCSSCSQWVTMRAVYDTLRFSEHRGSKKCRNRQGSGFVSKSLVSLGFVFKKKDPRPTLLCMAPFPCPGLTAESDPKVATYLSRTPEPYGGAPSRLSLARERFGNITSLTELTEKQTKMVKAAERNRAQWRNAHNLDAVFASLCEGVVYAADEYDARPCEACKDLYRIHLFQNAISRKLPKTTDLKYTPKERRCEALGKIYMSYLGVRDLMEKDDGRSPWLKFAIGVVDGKYKSQVVLGMLEAFMAKADRIERGKSLRNMKYSGAFSDFCDVVACLSPVTYRTFQEHFGGRTTESMRRIRARSPRFQPGFSLPNVAAVSELLAQYDYHGPLALSWDDTELEPAISIYEESKDICVVIGGANDVIRVGHDTIDTALSEARLNQATKLRLWLLTIPLPKIPPILVAAVARGSSVNAHELKQMHDRVTQMLHAHQIHPISGACDGTETERSLQSLVSSGSLSMKNITISNSQSSKANISLSIPLVDGQHPFVAVQDSKHALKTARNQILSGARLLTIGNGVLHYQQLQDAAHSGSALLAADVGSGLDRQDDRAAARVFSAKMLDFNLRNNPDQRALSVYLFVLGELVDAWQNRRIGHVARAKMVMRARFFLMAWRSHVDAHPDHSVHTHFISRESFDIFTTLCDSLLALMVVHRTYYPHCPFVPWLHSTEPCEHVFGALRKLKPDFTYADMLSAERKLAVLVAGAFKNLTPEQKANATAAGYHHTYFDIDGLDLTLLSTLPTDQQLALASNAAFKEASQLLSSLGISLKKFLDLYVPPSNVQPPAPPPPQATLASLLSLYDNTWRTTALENDIATCEFALAADSAARSQDIEQLPEISAEDIQSIQSFLSSLSLGVEVSRTDNLSAASSTTTDPLTPLHILSSAGSIDNDVLVNERRSNQTEFASRAVRKADNVSMYLEMNARTFNRVCTKGLTLREQLIAKLKELEVELQGARKSGGVGRQVRHTGTFAGHTTTTQEQTKATVKGVAANKFLQLRDQAFAPLRGLIHENFPSANINQISRLSAGHFVLALSPTSKAGEVFLGEVVTIYSKGNGKNAKHEWVPSIDNLGVASYIYVRKFVPFAGASLFSSLACPKLSSSTFVQVPRTHLLFSLASFAMDQSQSVTANGFTFNLVNLCPLTTALFITLDSRKLTLGDLAKDLKARIAGKVPVVNAALGRVEEGEEEVEEEGSDSEIDA